MQPLRKVQAEVANLRVEVKPIEDKEREAEKAAQKRLVATNNAETYQNMMETRNALLTQLERPLPEAHEPTSVSTDQIKALRTEISELQVAVRLQDATALRAALLAKLGRSVREPSGGLTEIRKEIRELRVVGAAHEVSERKAATAGLRELAKYRRDEAASNSGGGSRRRKVAPTSRCRGRGRAAAKPRIRRG